MGHETEQERARYGKLDDGSVTVERDDPATIGAEQGSPRHTARQDTSQIHEIVSTYDIRNYACVHKRYPSQDLYSIQGTCSPSERFGRLPQEPCDQHDRSMQ